MIAGKPYAQIGTIIREWQQLQEDKKELCVTLKGMRGKNDNWREGIKDDKRKPVSLLYKALLEVESSLDNLTSTYVTEYEPEGNDLFE